MRLGEMKPGDRGRVLKIERGENLYRKRLLAFGVTPGVEFQVIRVAPLGDPVEIRLRDFSLSLRKQEAAIINVEPVPATARSGGER